MYIISYFYKTGNVLNYIPSKHVSNKQSLRRIPVVNNYDNPPNPSNKRKLNIDYIIINYFVAQNSANACSSLLLKQKATNKNKTAAFVVTFEKYITFENKTIKTIFL